MNSRGENGFITDMVAACSLGGIQFLPLPAAAKVEQVTSLRLSDLQVKASVCTRMGKSQSKEEVKDAGMEDRKEGFVSTYCKAMRSSSFLLSAVLSYSEI